MAEKLTGYAQWLALENFLKSIEVSREEALCLLETELHRLRTEALNEYDEILRREQFQKSKEDAKDGQQKNP